MGRGCGRTRTHRGAAPRRLRVAWNAQELKARGFTTARRDRLVLITPSRTKRSWTPDERILRSVITDTDGFVVSAGFPKFFNWGEDADDTSVLVDHLRAGRDVSLREKMDGSLCIRSVIDGKVVLRTRGTFDGGDMAESMLDTAAGLDPKLLDPQFSPDRSLLFEYTAPDNRIVLPYSDRALTLLGAVSHSDGSLMDIAQLDALADRLGVPAAHERPLPRDPEALVATVSELRGSEGIVAVCNGGQTLVKVKAAAYLHAHALRFAFTPRRVVELCEAHNIANVEELAAHVEHAVGMHDFELLEEANRTCTRYLDAKRDAARQLGEVERWVGANAHLERREFAAAAGAALGERASLAFAIRDGKADRAAQWAARYAADEATRFQSG